MHCTWRCLNSPLIHRSLDHSRCRPEAGRELACAESISVRTRADRWDDCATLAPGKTDAPHGPSVSFRIPVPLSEFAVRLHADSFAVEPDQHRAGAVGAQHLRAARAIAFHDVLFRVAEAVAIAGRKNGPARLHRGDEIFG